MHILVAMKPLAGSFAGNALCHGVAGLNIDGCRIGTTETLRGGAGGLLSNVRDAKEYPGDNGYEPSSEGRWPANVMLCHHSSDCPVVALDEQSGVLISGKPGVRRKPHETNAMSGRLERTGEREVGIGDKGGASRFFKTIEQESV